MDMVGLLKFLLTKSEHFYYSQERGCLIKTGKVVLLKLPKVIAHRGAPWVAPENTLSSLKRAKELGAQWTEFDVRLTQDDQAIIFHDDKLNRTTNGKGLVIRMPYVKMAQLDAGSWFDSQFQGERIPLLSQYLQTAAQLKLGINVELKGTDAPPEKLAKLVAENLQQYWSLALPPPLLSSFSVTNLHAMRALGKEYLLGFLMDEWSDQWQTIAAELNCVSVHVNQRKLTLERVKSIKQKNYLVLAYTVDDKKRAEELFSWGVDSVFSNNPQLLL